MVDVAHDLLATTECTNWHTTTNRLRQADKIGIDRIEFGDATWSNSHARFNLVEDQQYAMLSCDVAQILEITLLG